MITVDGGSLTIDAVVRAARGHEAVALDPGGRARMLPAREGVDRLDREGAVVYGVTTGFGALADRAVDPADRALLQRSVVLSHAAGSGPRLEDEVVRGMILLRARPLAAGLSGVRVDLVEALLGLLEAGIIPWVPEHGSLGASGDLAPLAAIATVLLGEGWAAGEDGGRIEGAAALRAHGLAVIEVAPKEGLALINGTDAMTSLLALAVHDIEDLLRLAVQDAYSLRCAPQVHGAARDVAGFCRQTVEHELASVVDNPVVLGDEVVSAGNFHGQALAYAADMLASACAHVAAISERRVDRLLDPARSRGLPAF